MAKTLEELQWQHLETQRSLSIMKMYVICATTIALLVGITFLFVGCAQAYSNNEIADAIFWAEGGYKTNYPYGIRSVNCEGYKDCRKVTLNTIRNSRRRYKNMQEKQNRGLLSYLASRYAPIGASNDPGNLNSHWQKNVTWFLNNPRKVVHESIGYNHSKK